jgi:Ferredoxin thioredoxin reductase variable alpha chain
MKIGDRVRVKSSIMVFHNPEHKGQPFDIQNLAGEIVSLVEDKKGRPVSPNYPFVVKLGEKFSTHLIDHELELIE